MKHAFVHSKRGASQFIFLSAFFHYYFCLLKTGRLEVPGSKPGHACRHSRSEFSMVFSKIRVNTGQDPLERPPKRAIILQSQVPQADNWTHTYIHPSIYKFLYSTRLKHYYFKRYLKGSLYTEFKENRWSHFFDTHTSEA